MVEVAKAYLIRSCSGYFVGAIGNDNRFVFKKLYGFGLFDEYLMGCRVNRTRDEH